MVQSSVSKIVVIFYNIAQLLGWTLILLKVILNLSKNNYAVLTDPQLLHALELVQTFQYLDLVFSILGLSQTKVVPSFIHVTTRTCVVWITFPYAINSPYPSLAIIPWALGDIIRFGNYLNDGLGLGLDFVKILRYNAFLVLYPLGLTGEFTSAGDAKTFLESEKINPKINLFGMEFPLSAIAFFTVFRIIAYPGLAYMYWHMLKLRSRFYKKRKEGEGKKVKTT